MTTASPQPFSRRTVNRAEVVDRNFIEFIGGLTAPGSRGSSWEEPLDVHGGDVGSPAMTGGDLLELFESQVLSRQMDFEARRMRARGEGFYTIGSSGHEGNALVGRLTRHTDMAFLHYRSGGFVCERSRYAPDMDVVTKTMLGFAASTDDTTSGGRHKVWGSKELYIPPQTSTIASHLPKAVGAALSIARAKKLSLQGALPADSIIVCSFGDASANHAVAQTAFNTAAWAAHQHIPVPVLFVCEDNGIGISVDTPSGWIEAQFSQRVGISYIPANGLNLLEGWAAVQRAVDHCRRKRVPTFLHMRTIRLMGHAGSDPETEYHSFDDIEKAEAQDPLLVSARLVVEHGLLTPSEVLERYEACRERVAKAAAYAVSRPKFTTAAAVMKTLAPYTPDRVAEEARSAPDHTERVRIFEGEERLPEKGTPRHMAVLINAGLQDMLIKYPEASLFGEDVAKKGGVYNVTNGLWKRFGAARVFNTLLDETTILGMGIGMAHLGMLPIPEIQYLAYYHNAEDQIRSEACSLQFFSNDQFRNPMVMRIAGWAYQKGFGGHFHNDNSIAVLRDVPGLVIGTPCRGDDAVKMMRTSLALAKVDGRVVALIEPIALYMTKDLHEPKDAGWSFAYPQHGESIALGEGHVYHPEANHLTILTFANGVYMSLRVAKALRETHGIQARVVDLRWLNPLNETFIAEQAQATGRVLIVDEGRKTGGVGEAMMTVLAERCGAVPVGSAPVKGAVIAARMTAMDTYIPLAAAADLVLPTEATILQAALALAQG